MMLKYLLIEISDKLFTCRHRGHFDLWSADFSPSTIVTDAAEQQHK